MNYSPFIILGEWLFLSYFIGINLSYIALNMLALNNITHYMQTEYNDVSDSYSEYMPPISLVVPAFNEESSIVTSIRSLLQLSYSKFEIIVINDGSSDNTKAEMIKAFEMEKYPDAHLRQLKTKPVKGLYISRIFPLLKLIDKENGGKADALNAGINVSKYPLFCAVDADSILERDSLQRVIKPFLMNKDVIASGGTIRIANGCNVIDGFLEEINLPRNPLALFQVVEYIRAFLFGRIGWSSLNALLIISGAFGLFKKNAVIEAGGYSTQTVCEDVELVVRLHLQMIKTNKKYKMVFLPDPICWTEAPEDLTTLKNQRVRWQRGLAESLTINRELLFHPKGGYVSWVAFPVTALFEWFGPFIEIAGSLFTLFIYYIGTINLEATISFFVITIALGLFLSVSSFLLEEISFHPYKMISASIILFIFSILENFGYRQLNSIWRLWGLIKWLTGEKGRWGHMKRRKKWTVS